MCRKDSRIRLLRNDKNMGLSYTLNRCMKHARGKYYARMDADDISKENRLEKQVLFLESHPEYSLVGCNAEFIDDQGVWGKRLMIEVPQKKDFLRTSVFIHPAILVRAEVMQQLHGNMLPETCALRTEDYELFMHYFIPESVDIICRNSCFRYREDVHAFSKSATKHKSRKKLTTRRKKSPKVLNLVLIFPVVCPLLTGSRG